MGMNKQFRCSIAIHLILEVQMSQSSPKSGRVVRSSEVFMLSIDKIQAEFGIVKLYLIFGVTEMKYGKMQKKLVSKLEI